MKPENTVFELRSGDSRGAFEFTVAGRALEVLKHFPGRPVAPGSLLLAFVWGLCGGADGMARFNGVHFARPLIPGTAYRCEVKICADASWYFVVMDEQQRVCVRGLMGGVQ